ncbi:MAG: N-acylglucosamine 2-epimerase [Lachnospiraceae bacterium]|nr:N-acylglucosamine 2-epimerase [Lachnospiraceae bacterium]
MEELVKEIRQHLEEQLIPFWEGLKDRKNGGYYGYVGYDLEVDGKAVKGCILNSRILWFFSNAFLILKDNKLLENARHAWQFMKDYCIDKESGGIFWSVTYDGKVEDDTKHTYNQAFAIYALSAYYAASGDEEALSMAEELYGIIEEHCTDEYGYLEAFDREFHPIENDKLSENGVIAEKTMNTLLHVFEAYTELYRVTEKEEVAGRLRFMLDLFLDKVYNPEARRQEVFFDRTWNSLIDLYSYGHDIETAWLLDRGLEVLGDDTYTMKISPVTREITQNIYDRAYKNHSLLNEAENGVDDTTRIWWVQAEAVVGFINGYQKDNNCREYLEAAEDIWAYIKEYLLDKRDGSEWYWAVDSEGQPLEKPVVEPWKCPYHNGRMCMEVIRRLCR